MEGILGQKLGMTQIFADDGTAVPVTVIAGGSLRGRAAQDRGAIDGYEAVQLGLRRGPRPPKKSTKPREGPLREGRRRRRCGGSASSASPRARTPRPGDEVKVSIFAARGVRGRDRHQQGQGLPGRHQAPRLPRRPRHPRLDVPPRAGLDRRLVRTLRACSRACAAPGRMGGERVTAKNLQRGQGGRGARAPLPLRSGAGPARRLPDHPPGEEGMSR